MIVMKRKKVPSMNCKSLAVIKCAVLLHQTLCQSSQGSNSTLAFVSLCYTNKTFPEHCQAGNLPTRVCIRLGVTGPSSPQRPLVRLNSRAWHSVNTFFLLI